MIINKVSLISTFPVIFYFFHLANPVLAHVIVFPSKVGIAKLQTFDMTVPTEKDKPTVAVKLLIPQKVTDVVPNAKQGWNINLVKNGDNVTEIDWTNGSLAPGQRDDFYFEAQVPPIPATLYWKAYQTYSDGTVVSWDINPESLKNLSDSQQDQLADSENKGEYSTTNVVNDLTGFQTKSEITENNSKLPIIFSIVALAISGLSLGLSLGGRKR